MFRRAKALAERRQSRSYQYRIVSVAALGLLAFLPACSTSLPSGLQSGRAPFPIAVVADEPKAAIIGADMLKAGALAADAAVATYFALAVTLPTSAGLGGGGVCLGYDAQSGKSEVIDFMPRATQGGGMTVPSSVRGMAMVYNRWGGQGAWAELLMPAEQLARNGAPISRAFHRQADDFLAKLEKEAARIFLTESGALAPEGSVLRQIELASLLGRIAARGGGEFYSGILARQIVDAAQASGHDLTLADLRQSVPRILPPIDIALTTQLHSFVASSPGEGGAVFADIASRLNEARFAKQEPAHRPQAMVKAQEHAYASALGKRRDPLEKRFPPGAGFSIVDKNANAVSCAFTMMAAMGSGRILPNTGMLVAPPPSAEVASLVPVITVDKLSRRTVIALAATGGQAAAAAAAQVTMSLSVEGYPLDDAQYRPRMLADSGETVHLEPEAGDSAAVLREQGYRLAMTPDLGRVNAIFCPPSPALPSCAAFADPRGAGFAP